MYGEFELVEKIKARFARPDGVTLGIGDDAAVLDPGRFDLVTTDTMVEGVHFDRRWSSGFDIGWKLVAVNLSDVAAMGGGPGIVFLNLTLPRDTEAAFADALIDGIQAACDELVPESFDVGVAGGDVTSTDGPLVLTLTMMGECSPAGPVLRSGAVPGDRVAVLGHLGMAAAGLDLLRGAFDGADPADYPALVEAHTRPIARVHEGAMLGLYGVPSALMDISDGLAQDLGKILAASGAGAWVEVHSLPRHPELARLEREHGADALSYILSGGDDYELVITVPPARMPKLWELARRYEWDVYDLGEVRSAEEGLRLIGPDGSPLELDTRGWDHFAGDAE
jgi:thiamine-monophosphate kinase